MTPAKPCGAPHPRAPENPCFAKLAKHGHQQSIEEMKHYNSLYVIDQKNLSIPKPGGELGENVIAALDAFHSAVARASNSDGVGVARPMEQCMC